LEDNIKMYLKEQGNGDEDWAERLGIGTNEQGK
jgi:hypothetical protein